jgi:hypothetical protein
MGAKKKKRSHNLILSAAIKQRCMSSRKAELRRGLADTLAGLIADPRDGAHITHTVADLLRARMLAIACGYKLTRLKYRLC